METTIEHLIKQAMSLPNESRAELADRLVQSLDTADLGPIDRLWMVEAKRRRDEIRSGQIEAIAGEDALHKVRETIR